MVIKTTPKGLNANLITTSNGACHMGLGLLKKPGTTLLAGVPKLNSPPPHPPADDVDFIILLQHGKGLSCHGKESLEGKVHASSRRTSSWIHVPPNAHNSGLPARSLLNAPPASQILIRDGTHCIVYKF